MHVHAYWQCLLHQSLDIYVIYLILLFIRVTDVFIISNQNEAHVQVRAYGDFNHANQLRVSIYTYDINLQRFHGGGGVD